MGAARVWSAEVHAVCVGWRCGRALRNVKLGYPVVDPVPGDRDKRMKVGMVERRGGRDQK